MSAQRNSTRSYSRVQDVESNPSLEFEEREELNQINIKNDRPSDRHRRRGKRNEHIVGNTCLARLGGTWRRGTVCALVFYILLTILLTVILVAEESKRHKKNPDNNTADVNGGEVVWPDAPSTPSDIVPSHQNPRERDIYNKLYDMFGDYIYHQDTPQNKAAKWIVKKDDLTVASTDTFLSQRFVLALLYFQKEEEMEEGEWGTWLDSTKSECVWDGVQCNQDGNVEKLVLKNRDLSGSIPEELITLKNLWHLDMRSNKLEGRIPQELGKLQDLKHLLLEDNMLSGLVPQELCLLREKGTLEILTSDCTKDSQKIFCNCCTNCAENHNSGYEISGSDNTFSTSPDRAKVIIGMCAHISGEATSILNSPQNLAMKWIIDDDEMMMNIDDKNFVQRYVMATMYFSLGGESWTFSSSPWLSPTQSECGFEGVTCDSEMKVTQLEFEGKGLVGSLPPEMSNCDKLKLVNFKKNAITGNIPYSWGGLIHLESLLLTDNKLVGMMPQPMCSLLLMQGLHDFQVDCDELSCSCCSNCDAASSTGGSDGFIAPPENDTASSSSSSTTTTTTTTTEEDGDKGSSSSIAIPSPSQAPTKSYPADTIRTAGIRQFLRKVSSQKDPGSKNARLRAENWIIHEDTMTKGYSIESMSSDQLSYLEERYILIVFFYQLSGEHWNYEKKNEFLVSGKETCKMAGISCSHDNFHVNSITLPNSNLHGVLPYEIGQLEYLQVLDLSQNRLEGPIPEELSQLPLLKLVTLTANELTGSVPESICMLREQGSLSKLKVDHSANDPFSVSCGSAKDMNCCDP